MDAAAVLFELEFCIARRAVTHLALDQGAELDEQQRCCGARGDCCICPAERKTTRRHDPPRVAHRGRAAALPEAARCVQGPGPGAVRKRSRDDRLGAGGARSSSRLLDAAPRRRPKSNRQERGDRTSALPRSGSSGPTRRRDRIRPKQPQTADDAAQLLCEALRARSSLVSALSRWTSWESAPTTSSVCWSDRAAASFLTPPGRPNRPGDAAVPRVRELASSDQSD